MSAGDLDLDELGVVYLDGGPPPAELLDTVALWRRAHPKLVGPPPTRAEVEAWFANAAEEVKRARGGP
jgi:hypothetical protein